MNYFVFVAGVLALLATLGHFAMGYKLYIKPVESSNVAIVPKKIVLCLFHYMSAFLLISTIVLFSASVGDSLLFDSTRDVVRFIGIVYAGLAVAQLAVAFNSSIKRAHYKLFQWIFWLLIALFSLLGSFS